MRQRRICQDGREVIAVIRTAREALVAIILATAIVAASIAGARAQQIVALVNGQPITALDVEYRSKFMQLSTKKVPARKEVIDSLIDEILEVNEAKRFTT